MFCGSETSSLLQKTRVTFKITHVFLVLFSQTSPYQLVIPLRRTAPTIAIIGDEI